MIIYRRARQDEYQAYLSFANMVFSIASGEHHFDTLIPKVYGKEQDTADLQYLAVDTEKGIRGLVACMPTTINTASHQLKAGYIGTVSVHPDSRGEGYMKALMARTIAENRAAGTDLLMLGGLRQRYQYYGFLKGGERYQYTVGEPNIRHALQDVKIDGITFEEIEWNTPDEAYAVKLLAKQAMYYDRNTYGYAMTCRSFGSIPWIIKRYGKCIGTIVSNLDRSELRQILHEGTEIAAILKAWQFSTGLKWIKILMPAWQKRDRLNLNRFAEGISYGWNNGIYIMNYRRVLEAMITLKTTYMRVQDGEMGFSVDGQTWTISVCQGEVFSRDGAKKPIELSHEEAGNLFLSPFEYSNKPDVPEGWFPLPLFTCSADEF